MHQTYDRLNNLPQDLWYHHMRQPQSGSVISSGIHAQHLKDVFSKSRTSSYVKLRFVTKAFLQMTKCNNIWKLIIYKTIIYYFSHFTRHQIVWLTKNLLWRYCIKINETLPTQNWLQGVFWQTETIKIQRCANTQRCHMISVLHGGTDGITVGISFGSSAPFKRNSNY